MTLLSMLGNRGGAAQLLVIEAGFVEEGSLIWLCWNHTRDLRWPYLYLWPPVTFA